MPLRLAILGLDPFQRDWLEALCALRASDEIDLVGVAHRTLAAARETAHALKSDGVPASSHAPPAFDDLRLLLNDAAPQLILLDRPSNVSLEFLLTCFAQNIAIFSLGPAVESLAEAQSLAAVLPPRTHLLYTWPRFADSASSRASAQVEEYLRPIRFATAAWMGMNYALAKSPAYPANLTREPPVRSLSVLAWDALGTLIRFIDLPTSVYAAVRGTIAAGNSFADISGALAITARFPDDVAAGITISDRALSFPFTGRASASYRDLLLWGSGGTLHLDTNAFQFSNNEGQLIDSGPTLNEQHPASSLSHALEALREFIRHYTLPASPDRGWEHHLEEIAATMEAIIVSHRTGQAESPERFRRLRR